MNRWQQKAASFRSGWRTVFGVEPPEQAVILGLAVGEHETRNGDAWPGENNIGAVQLPRKLTTAEKAALAGIVPHPNTVAAAREALTKAGIVEPKGALHADSSPGKGYYFIWFARFDTEAEGFAHFIRTIAVNANRGASCKPALELGAVSSLARAMYNTRYYEGFYKKAAFYARSADGKWVEAESGTPGSELNIAAYARALYALIPSITAGIAGEAPRPTIKRGSHGFYVKEWQRIIGVPDDGVFGPKTEAMTMLWQQANHLTPDGIVGVKTWGAGLAD